MPAVRTEHHLHDRQQLKERESMARTFCHHDIFHHMPVTPLFSTWSTVGRTPTLIPGRVCCFLCSETSLATTGATTIRRRAASAGAASPSSTYLRGQIRLTERITLNQGASVVEVGMIIPTSFYNAVSQIDTATLMHASHHAALPIPPHPCRQCSVADVL